MSDKKPEAKKEEAKLSKKKKFKVEGNIKADGKYLKKGDFIELDDVKSIKKLLQIGVISE